MIGATAGLARRVIYPHPSLSLSLSLSFLFLALALVQDIHGDGVKIALGAESGPPPESSIAVQVPLRVCVENCESGSTTRRTLQFEGELKQSNSAAAPPIVSGKFTMEGWWYSAFGEEMLHLNNVVAEVGVTFPPMRPTKIVLGGQVCLGSKASCAAGKSDKTLQGAGGCF